jgi:hypothetical protein
MNPPMRPRSPSRSLTLAWCAAVLAAPVACNAGGTSNAETDAPAGTEDTSASSDPSAATTGTPSPDTDASSSDPGTTETSADGSSGPAESTSTDDGGTTGAPAGCDDDDCDGATQWNRRFGAVVSESGREAVEHIAAMPDGGAVIVGRIGEWASFDDLGIVSAPAGFVVRVDPDGTAVWLREIQAEGTLLFDDIVSDADGNLVITGGAYGDLDIETQTLAHDDLNWGPFVLGLDADGGDRFAIRPSGGAYGEAQLAMAADGKFGFVASLAGGIDIDGTAVSSNAGSEDFFAVVFDSDGEVRWARAYGGDNLERGTGAAFDAAGDLYVTGNSVGPVDFGFGALRDLGYSVTIAKLAGDDGEPQWARQFGSHLGTPRLAGDGGRVFLATDGTGYLSTVDFGTGSVEGFYFLAAFDATGTTTWARGFGDDYVIGGAPGVAAAGTDVVVALGVTDGVDLGDGVLASGTGTFVAKYGGDDGTLLWARTATGDGYQAANDVAALPDGRSFVGGEIVDAMDFGIGPLEPTGPGVALYNADGYVVALAP